MKTNKNTFISIFFLVLLLAAAGSWAYKNNAENAQNPVEYVLSSIENINVTPEVVFNKAWRIVKNNYVDTTCNHQDWKRWQGRYDDKIKTNEDSYVAIESMVESLNDPYTRFLTPDEFTEQDRSIDAKLFGIGVHIADIKGNAVIVNVIEDTPAAKSGLKAGDRILKVNGKSTKGLPLKDIADAVRGKVGTKVVLLILRDKKQLTKAILRQEIKIKAVKYKMLDNKYAYIKISTFISTDTAYEVAEALKATEKAKGIIIDLRGNHGGLLPNAIMISNMFIKKGTIVSVVDRNGSKQEFNAEPENIMTSKPTVILINGESASASEILSGALKDHKRALLVGETTFGKGLVQRILKLPDGSGLNLTVAKYLTPNGNDIGHKGIKPDYKVAMTEKEFLAGKDPQLSKAKQILASEINKTKIAVSQNK
ncbi:MAG: hypothetical protein A2104_05730 [Candidatus Melainabacteria bacterium GWF2_32_7]|nr:MAG: hypothetical protein A2104_05730 [Candidatus Melainabacteria bacterium GWF2_32_7]